MKNETKNEARNRQRLEAKLRDWLSHYKAVFITLTFNDETLENTSEEQREALVIDYLRKETAFYIANKDYGSTNGREHYHAVAVANTLSWEYVETLENGERYNLIKNRINLRPWRKNYGQIESNFIGLRYRTANDKNANEWKETAHNLAEHFRKESAKNSRLIFSRGPASEAEQLERIKRLDEDLRTDKAERLARKRARLGIKEGEPLSNEDFMRLELEEIDDFNKKFKGF